MSAVLRKKIQAGAGMPPTLLQFRDFWDHLRAIVSNWALDALDTESKPIITARRVVAGDAIDAALDTRFVFGLSSPHPDGPCAIGLNISTATRHAAVKLNEPADGMAETAPLFLRLLCEEPVGALWAAFSEGLTGRAPEKDTLVLTELADFDGSRDAGMRYLQLSFELTLEGALAEIRVLFDFEMLQKHLVGQLRAASARKGSGNTANRKTLGAQVRASHVDLDTVLERLQISIGDCSRLEVGQVISLPGVSLSQVALAAETVNGTVDIGHGEMGVWREQRAFKLNEPIDARFAHEAADF